MALHRVKYCSLFLKSSFILGRLSFHFLYDDILLFFFVAHQTQSQTSHFQGFLLYLYLSIRNAEN